MIGIYLALVLFGLSFMFYIIKLIKKFMKEVVGGDRKRQ